MINICRTDSVDHIRCSRTEFCFEGHPFRQCWYTDWFSVVAMPVSAWTSAACFASVETEVHRQARSPCLYSPCSPSTHPADCQISAVLQAGLSGGGKRHYFLRMDVTAHFGNTSASLRAVFDKRSESSSITSPGWIAPKGCAVYCVERRSSVESC